MAKTLRSQIHFGTTKTGLSLRYCARFADVAVLLGGMQEPPLHGGKGTFTDSAKVRTRFGLHHLTTEVMLAENIINRAMFPCNLR